MTSLTTRLRRPPWFAGLPREVALLSVVAFCVALGFGIVAPALPVFATSFGVNATQASSVISVFALLRLIGAIPAGWLINRFGERRVLATGLSIVALSSALAGLSTTFMQLLLLRGVGGLGSAMFSVSAMALLLHSVGAEQRGRAAGAFQGGFLLGGVAGPAVGGLVTGISIRAPFFVYAATLAAAVAVVVVSMPAAQADQADQADQGHPQPAPDPLLAEPGLASSPTGTAGPAETGAGSLRLALRQRPYLTALTINLGNGFTSFGLRSAIVPLFVVYALHLSPSWTGYGLLASALAQALLLLPAGRMADTRGRRPALLIGTSATAGGFLALAATGSIPVFLLAMGILGVGSAFLGSAPAALVGDISGGRRSGPIVATYQMTSDVGAIAGPLVAGYILDSTGSYTIGFAIGAAVVAVGLVLAAVTPETLRRADAAPPS